MILSCIYKELLDMHELGETPQELHIWREYLAVKKVFYYIPHKSTIQIFYSSMDWVDEYIAKMEIHQGKNHFASMIRLLDLLIVS